MCELARKIETETCPRCGGDGSYSFSYMHGSRCFECGGKGLVYTSIGKKAHDYLVKLRSKMAKDIKPGDKVWIDLIGKWLPVIECKPAGRNYSPDQVILVCKSFAIVRRMDQLVRIAMTAEEKKNTLLIALDYQDALKKS